MVRQQRTGASRATRPHGSPQLPGVVQGRVVKFWLPIVSVALQLVVQGLTADCHFTSTLRLEGEPINLPCVVWHENDVLELTWQVSGAPVVPMPAVRVPVSIGWFVVAWNWLQ
jgi:hypothetical protein